MPKRIQRKRTKGWKMPENAVYVGRPSKFGNPFSVADAPKEHDAHEWACQEFRLWLSGHPRHKYTHWLERALIQERLHILRGKDLACWCSLDQPCHADVLLEIANS